jgi:HSP20 family protein
MSQLVRFNTSPTLRSIFENFWGHDLMEDNPLERGKMPAVNVKDNEKNYEIDVSAPGMKKEDFNISVENRILTISAEVKDEKEVKEDKYTRREFVSSSFNRSFSLPENVEENNIEAKYENGILKVTVPKAQEQKPEKKTIALK